MKGITYRIMKKEMLRRVEKYLVMGQELGEGNLWHIYEMRNPEGTDGEDILNR